MHATILDAQTGQRADSRDRFESGRSVYWWTAGNGSCDCNRMTCFGHGDDSTAGLCAGCERYLVIDVHGDLEGSTREECVRMANQDYPPELVARHLPDEPPGALITVIPLS